jgi:hypothetical protein
MRFAFATMVVLLGSFAPAHAGQITYVVTMYGGSGVLDGTKFTNATVVATFTGDTSNITTYPGTTAPAIPVSGTVSVQGAGTDTLTDSPMYLLTYASAQLGPVVVFLDEGPGGIGWPYPGGCPDGDGPSSVCYGIGEFVTESASLAGYNLTGPFGPILGSGGGSTISSISSDCAPYPSAPTGPECAYYPTGSGGTFYWTASPTSSTFAAAPAVQTTYSYKGSNFTSCDGGAPPTGEVCPANYTSDYDTATLSFTAPLPPNLSNVNVMSLPSFTAWQIGDAQGEVSFSSTKANYQFGAASFAENGFFVSTNGDGNITAWSTCVETLNYSGHPGQSYICIFSPTGINGQGQPYADALSYNGGDGNPGPTGGWNLGNGVPGAWTESVSGFQGGTTSAPVFVLAGSSAGSVAGTISGQGAEDYYGFYWNGGAFSASASVGGASNAASYLFTEGTTAGLCSGGASITLNQANNFTGTIAMPNLEPGEYCIGLNANNSNDPPFSLTFNTPVSPAYTDAFFNGQQALSPVFSYLQFANGSLFGYYAFLQGSASTASAWLYHPDLGYEYVTGADPAGDLYFYDLASNHWWYSSASLFPYLYDFNLNSWIYYFPDTSNPGHYTTNPRYFSNFTTGKIFTM